MKRRERYETASFDINCSGKSGKLPDMNDMRYIKFYKFCRENGIDIESVDEVDVENELRKFVDKYIE